ncbi:MAG: phosphatidate cytidylyltransferase [Muribaculaceae bacterium]|nr:phosphatidate cytidylyltransferase [Muribaculaceae bacterium]MDE6755100.1 phosphatidate cytidylyltransferase [Muribaculaceae bacterium]
MNIKSLLLRTVSGIVYIAIIVGCILWGSFPLSIMAAAFAALAIVEFEKITKELSSATVPTLLLDIAGGVCFAFGWMFFPMIIWIFVILCRMTLELYIKSPTPLANLAKSLMAQLYIALPLGIMAAMGEWWGTHLILAVFCMIWINDTGAFVVGSLLGKHRLFERVSPKKSWEGFFGGLAFNLATGALFSSLWAQFFGLEGLWQWLVMGVIVTVFATWGDLVESLIKRTLHIKDSGNLIPGHGGILDRIDSLLFVMPAVFIYVFFLKLI